MRRLALPAALSLLAWAGCNPDYPNPFADATQTATAVPPAGAAVVFTSDAWNSTAGRGRELMAVSLDGTGLTRLTFCDNGADRLCDTRQAALAADRERAAVLRALDSNSDGRVDQDEPAALIYVDLERSGEAELVASSARVTGVDWSPTADLLVYSAEGGGGEDLFRTDPTRPTPENAQNTANLTCPGSALQPGACDTALSERRGRIDDSGSVAVFERTTVPGPTEVWVFQTSTQLFRVTTATAGGAPLQGTPYREGADADPDFAPDGRTVAFRHLVAAIGRGHWQIRSSQVNAAGLTTIVAGAAWRGAPDWGQGGIVFPETDASGTRLVLIQPDGSGRRELVRFPPDFRIDNPRWLR